MVCQWPSARSLSQARSEGAWRENLAKADMSASAKAISVSPTRLSGRLAKPLCTKRKSASAERCFRPCGATIDMENPITRRSKRSSQGVFSHRCLRKASSADTGITRLGGSSGIAVVASTFCLALTGGKRFGKTAVGEIPQQPCDIAELVVRHGVAHRGSHLEKHCHIFRAKPVVAAFLED